MHGPANLKYLNQLRHGVHRIASKSKVRLLCVIVLSFCIKMGVLTAL